MGSTPSTARRSAGSILRAAFLCRLPNLVSQEANASIELEPPVELPAGSANLKWSAFCRHSE